MYRQQALRYAPAFCLLIAATARAQVPDNSTIFKHWVTQQMTLSVVGGRLVASGNAFRYGNGSQSMSNGSMRESVTFEGNGMRGSFKYQRTNTGSEFLFEISSEGRFNLRNFEKSKPDENLDYLQSPGRPVTLTLGPEGKTTAYTAPTLWHLLILHGDECRRQFVPMLEAIRPQMQLGRLATSVETALVRMASTGKQADRKQWQAWVDQLGDAKFTRREAADRKLRAVGPLVLGFLNRLDPDALDVEQHLRVRRIVKALSSQTAEDTADAVASSLLEDPLVWVALASRSNEATRKIAVQQLASILGGPVGIDPAADPATQAKAREELRTRIEKRQPESSGGKKT